MGRHDDGAAQRAFFEYVKKNLAVAGVQSIGALVQQQQGGRTQQRPAQKQQPQLPLGKGGHGPVEQTFGLKAGSHAYGGVLAGLGLAAAVTVHQGGVFKACEQDVESGKVPRLALIVFLLRR